MSLRTSSLYLVCFVFIILILLHFVDSFTMTLHKVFVLECVLTVYWSFSMLFCTFEFVLIDILVRDITIDYSDIFEIELAFSSFKYSFGVKSGLVFFFYLCLILRAYKMNRVISYFYSCSSLCVALKPLHSGRLFQAHMFCNPPNDICVSQVRIRNSIFIVGCYSLY